MQITVNLTAREHAVRWMVEKATLLPSPLSDDVWSARSLLIVCLGKRIVTEYCSLSVPW